MLLYPLLITPTTPAQLHPCLDGLLHQGVVLPERLADPPGLGVALLRELTDLLGHHGEPLPRLTGMGRLYGRIEGEEVGASGDLRDGLGDLEDLSGVRTDPVEELPRPLESPEHC